MRERAAREAEAAGLGLTADSLAHLAGEAGSSVIPDVTPKRPGRKRKSEAIDEAEKKARLDEEQAVAHAAVAAAAAAAQLGGHDDLGAHSLESLEALGSHDLVAHDDLGHGLNAHDALSAHDALGHDGMIDPALAGEGIDQNSTVLDLPPLEHSTLGQVIQSLNPAH
jgi:hypothetical protein